MSWNYKGIAIELAGERFRAVMDEKVIFKPSLAAVKKEIDNRQNLKASAVVLNLPVVILRRSSRSSIDKQEIFHGAITGLNPETREVEGIEAPKGWQNSEILPDSAENTKRLEALIDAREKMKAAENGIEGREVSLWMPAIRSKPMPYGEAVKRIQDNYANAKKAKAE